MTIDNEDKIWAGAATAATYICSECFLSSSMMRDGWYQLFLFDFATVSLYIAWFILIIWDPTSPNKLDQNDGHELMGMGMSCHGYGHELSCMGMNMSCRGHELSWAWTWVVMGIDMSCHGHGHELSWVWTWVVMGMDMSCHGYGHELSWAWTWVVMGMGMSCHDEFRKYWHIVIANLLTK